MTTSHEFSKHNQSQKRCMNIYGLNVIYCYEARHIVRGKRFYFLAED